MPCMIGPRDGRARCGMIRSPRGGVQRGEPGRPAAAAREGKRCPADNEAAVWRAFEAWNRGDLEGYLSMYDREVVLHGYQGVEPGFENVRRFYQGITAAFRVAEPPSTTCSATASG